jgi:ParB family chromosome partitioning protein
MVSQEKETAKANPEIKKTPEQSKSAKTTKSSGNSQKSTTPTVKNSNAEIKPDLLSTLQEKDRKNKEEALENILEEARALIKDTDIPPVEITPFEETLINFILLSFLDRRHYDYFGIPDGQTMSEDVALGLYSNLTEEQKNMLKRNFLIKNLVFKNGIRKSAALLIELAKHHFPVEMEEIENIHNDEYLKKRVIIKEQIDKIQTEMDELKDVA